MRTFLVIGLVAAMFIPVGEDQFEDDRNDRPVAVIEDEIEVITQEEDIDPDDSSDHCMSKKRSGRPVRDFLKRIMK